jgi:hypothetical protein
MTPVCTFCGERPAAISRAAVRRLAGFVTTLSQSEHSKLYSP